MLKLLSTAAINELLTNLSNTFHLSETHDILALHPHEPLNQSFYPFVGCGFAIPLVMSVFSAFCSFLVLKLALYVNL